MRSVRALSQQLKHHGADIDGIRVEHGIACKQACKKPAVSVAQDQSPAAIHELRKEITATPGERGAQTQVFKPAVRTGNSIKVWFTGGHLKKGATRSGVRSARSAAARM